MRTTLTLDDDVAVQLEDLRKKSGASLKDVVNEALRRGLTALEPGGRPAKKPFKVRVFDMGPALIPLDNVAEALALAEGEDFK